MQIMDGVGPGLLAAIGVLLVLQITLQVIALVQLVKTPADRVSIGGRKWVWAVIIVLGEIIGPILWFVIGRSPAPAQGAASGDGVARRSAVDTLYGESDD